MDDRNYCYKNEAGNFKVVEGDIFAITEKTDVLVVPARRKPVPGNGLDRRVYELAGNKLREARKNNLNITEVEETSAFALNGYTYLYHVVPPSNSLEDRNHMYRLLGKCYENCIKLAKEKGVGSIVFPLIGSGMMRFGIHESYVIAKEAINKAVNRYQAEDINIRLVLVEDYYWIISSFESVCGENGRSVTEYDDDDRVPYYDIGEEFLMRVKEMQIMYRAMHQSFEIQQEIEWDTEKYLDEDRDNRTEKGFALREIGRKTELWIESEISKNQEITSKSAALNRLTELSTVGSRTLNNLFKKMKTYNDKEAFGQYRLFREMKICLAIAMGFSKKERARFVLLDEKNGEYPANEEERLIEEYAEKTKTNKVAEIEKMVGKKLGNSNYTIRKDSGSKNAEYNNSLDVRTKRKEKGE